MSVLSDLLNRLPQGTQFKLVDNVDPAVSLPQKDTAFVRPILKIESTEILNTAPIVIISAPGAVGKSALARFIAAEKSCHYWDLSRLRLGTNTFKGTLADAFDPEDYSQLVKDVRRGDILFVLDAFDEAEIVSGWSRVEEFLRELFGIVKDAKGHTVILLARSTTAFLMDMFLDELASEYSKARCHVTLSIDYFVEQQAIDFVRLQLEKMGKAAHRQHHSAFQDSVQMIFSLFYSVVKKNDVEKPWNTFEVRSFLGYAPVLQAIARYIAQFDNYAHIQNAFEQSASLVDGTDLVALLMNDLLEREQRKLVQQLEQAGLQQAAGWNLWHNLYTPAEQLKRMFLRLHPDQSHKIKATQVEEDQDVPSWLVTTYTNALKNFIEQHPFMLDNAFTGPAFQDYTFARLLADKCLYDEVKDVWHTITNAKKTYISSPLFALLYLKINGHEVSADLVGHIYESAVSKQQFQIQPRLIIIPREDDEGDNVHWCYIISSEEEMGINKSDTYLNFRLNMTDDLPVSFLQRLSHAYIEIKGKLVLGRSDIVFELTNCEILCNRLEIHSNTIVIRNYGHNELVSVQADEYFQDSHVLNIDAKEPSKVSISWPGGQQYPWSNYYVLPIHYESSDFEEALLALRRLLSFFRKDKKDTFARYKDLVDNLVVGKKPLRRALLQYLIDKEVISSNDHLYILDMKALERHGINFTSLSQATLNDSLQRFIQEFLIWTQNE